MLCGERDEIVKYIITEYSKLAQKEYKTRYNWVRKIIHWELYKRLNFDLIDKWHMYKPESVWEKKTYKILRDLARDKNRSPNIGEKTRLHLYRGIRPSTTTQWVSWYDTKQSDGEAGALGNMENSFIAIALRSTVV